MLDISDHGDVKGRQTLMGVIESDGNFGVPFQRGGGLLGLLWYEFIGRITTSIILAYPALPLY